MIAAGLVLGLTRSEAATVRKVLGREPNETEWAIIDAEWSEHSSYKSSRALLKLFPTSGKRVLLGPGYDAGVIDVGKGDVVTIHIESHNHPSAVDPYGGASTGIGGVLRDILSMGTRPIALLDVLRFGDPEVSGHSRWLLRNVVKGIADYGNCVGVPTVAGDIEFDESFEKNCLVDVACIGVGKKDLLTLGEARRPGDAILMVGGSTGRDGVGGASFASKNLAKGPESDRKSVQVPDPFMKKLLLDSLLEVVETGCLHGMKDLGGGGLSTGLSELAAKGGTGIDVELSRVRQREKQMSPREIMTSESQERMLLVLDPKDAGPVVRILERYGVPHSVIGTVTGDGSLKIRWRGEVMADLPAQLVTEAPLISWPARRPPHHPAPAEFPEEPEIAKSLVALLSSPNVSSRRWVFEQYDHEVGLRTVVKPGNGDAALLRLPNGAMLAAKADANSRHSSLDPRRGAAGCVAEACRNVVTLGAEPVALVDHLQFGDPSDPEVYWAFRETVEGMAEYCRGLPIPVVGGKVSFYNEDASTKRAIKPSPVAMVVGISPGRACRASAGFQAEGESVYLLGSTRKEMGASEYYERVLKVSAGVVPKADPLKDSGLFRAMIRLVRSGTVNAAHDCSRGGLAVALAEMCIPSGVGAKLDIAAVRKKVMTPQEALFSESHGRFVVSTRTAAKLEATLSSAGIGYARLGSTGGTALKLTDRGRRLATLEVSSLSQIWEAPLGRLMA